jgi:hypothetical protein
VFFCKFSRHDFTLAQFFACLVLREFHGVSYRRAEALLNDNPEMPADGGLKHAPDQNTLCRAFHRNVRARLAKRMLDLLAKLFAEAILLGLTSKPLAIDSTIFEARHRSPNYDRRCRRMADGAYGKSTQSPGKWGRSVNAARSRQHKAMPKLAVAVASGCHLILSFKVRTGNGSDAPDFDDLLYHAWRRAGVKVVVADAGYDSGANHRIARQDMGVRSIIPPGIGRPTGKPPTGRWRRHMAKRFARKADRKQHGQRSQSEAVHSINKRNQEMALRARTAEGIKNEMMLKVLVQNITLLCDQMQG